MSADVIILPQVRVPSASDVRVLCALELQTFRRLERKAAADGVTVSQAATALIAGSAELLRVAEALLPQICAATCASSHQVGPAKHDPRCEELSAAIAKVKAATE
jgi:hypothetical protein